MNRTTKIHVACAVGWLLLTVGYFAFYYDSLLSLFTSVAGGALFLVGILLAVSAAMVGIRGKTKLLPAVAVVVVAAAIVGWFTPIGTTFGAHVKLWREMAYYELVIAKISSGADQSEIGHAVTIDSGPPQRMAFSWGGILDNWRGIVYDPSGEVMKANILDLENWSNRNDADYSSVQGLFGGTLIRAQHLKGDWYLCWFT